MDKIILGILHLYFKDIIIALNVNYLLEKEFKRYSSKNIIGVISEVYYSKGKIGFTDFKYGCGVVGYEIPISIFIFKNFLFVIKNLVKSYKIGYYQSQIYISEEYKKKLYKIRWGN